MFRVGRRRARALLSPSVQKLRTAVRYRRDERIWDLLATRFAPVRLREDTLHLRTTTPFSEVDGQAFSSDVNSHLLAPGRSLQQQESVSILRSGGYVVSDGGWIISGSNRLVDSCLIDAAYAARPSFWRYLRARLGLRGSVREIPRIIHLRDWGEANYWHFLNDIVGGRIRLAQTMGLSGDAPLLLGRRAFERPFVREILAMSGLARMKLIIQDDELVRYREAIFFQTPRHSLDSVNFFLDFLGAPGGHRYSTKRVFLKRGEGASRRISNIAEVETVCRRNGFEIVQPDTLPFHEQMNLFARVRYLVAEHGAGLTNIAFRRGAPLGLLEIFPGWSYIHGGWLTGHPPPHYFWLAHALGFQYDAMAGHGTAAGLPAGTFHVDPNVLEQKIYKLLGKPLAQAEARSGSKPANRRIG